MLIALGAAMPGAAQQVAPRDVILATTTSLHDAGLLDTLATLFEQATGYHLRVVAVGSGQALKMGERGDADVVLSHSPLAEEAFMARGFGTRRQVVATNYFTIVGPPADTTWLRITARTDPSTKEILLTPFTSRDGSSWTRGGTWTLPPKSDIRVGLLSHGARGSDAPATARFDYVRLYTR